MRKRAFSIDRTENTLLVAALSAVSSVVGYSIAHFVFFETIVVMMGGPAASPAYTEVREVVGVTFLFCGIPLLAILTFLASLYLEKRRNIRIFTIFDMGLVVAIALILGLLAYIPFQVFFLSAYAF